MASGVSKYYGVSGSAHDIDSHIGCRPLKTRRAYKLLFFKTRRALKQGQEGQKVQITFSMFFGSKIFLIRQMPYFDRNVKDNIQIYRTFECNF